MTDADVLSMETYIAQLIGPQGVRQTLEFEAASNAEAEHEANDGLDPLRGLWASVRRKPDPQQELVFDYRDQDGEST